jgi:hypothetical protein
MKRAYESLVKKEGLKASTFDSTIITVTDLYIRFLPHSKEEMNLLLDDPTLELFDFPLDHEIIEEGVYYHDPTIPFDAITWLYTSVKVNDILPEVEKEILEECFIPDEETKTRDPKLYSFLSRLEIESFKITGNLDDDFQFNESKAKPSGIIKVNNTQSNIPEGLRKAKVRVHNFVKWDSKFTNLDGSYQMSKKFLTNVHYAVIYENETGFKIWGNYAFLLPATYNLGWHSNSGKSITFHTNSVAWLWSTVNNASHIYREILCPQLGVSKPPANLRFWTFRTNGNTGTGSAPMARQISMNNSTISNLLVGYGVTWLTWYITLCLPDIFILKDFTDTRGAYETVFHELAHASHYTKVNNWYWLMYVTGVIGNGSNNPYGDGSGSNDGYIGVGEMWGYYFQYATAKKHYGSAGFNPNKSWFKPGIIQRLIENHGFTNQQIFNCLTPDVNNHYKLKNKIITNYGKATQVNEAFSFYGY